jgi:signal transduction histidine kinase
LTGGDLAPLVREVAHAAADLLRAESGIVTLVVEEGRFLRVAGASGPVAVHAGALVPVDGSLLGWAVTHDAPLVSDNMDVDPRNYRGLPTERPLRTVAIVPLRSASMVIGTVSVYNRADGRPFTEHDLHLLQTLGDQVVIGLDRTQMLDESRRNERALAAKNIELERATRLKSEFLANMSHELRTPLNAIIGFSDLMLSESMGHLNEQQRDFLESVLRNGRHLLALINSVLDIAKIEAGKMTLDLALTDAREALVAAVTDTASLRSAKRQECDVQLDPSSLAIIADKVRIQQILFNLLSNASKFTPEGGKITLAAVRTTMPLPMPATRASDKFPSLMNRDAIWISIIDTGIGIKREDTGKLFQEFSQIDASASRQAQGTGLGLALCKKFVEMHGGTIGVDSIVGKGSTFWFALPADGPVRRSIFTSSDG